MMNQEKQSYFSKLKWNLVGFLGKLLLDLIFCTIKVEIRGYEEIQSIYDSKNFIFAVWHSRLLAFSYLCKGLGGTVLVSASKDGEIAVRILQKQGNDTVRGSTTRGGIRAMAEMIRKLKQEGGPGAITPDGPQGPRFKVQPGVIVLAKKTGFPIIPVTYSGNRIKILASWDRFIIPYPFSTIQVIYGKPLFVESDIQRAEEQECVLRLEKEMQRITAIADHHFGHKIS